MSKQPVTTEELINQKWPVDVIKYRWLFLGVSILFLIPGIVFIVMNMTNPEIGAPLRLGIDFKGGTLLEYGFEKPVAQDNLAGIRAAFDQAGYSGAVVQIQEARVGINKKPVELGQPESVDSQAGSSRALETDIPDAEKVEAVQPETQPGAPTEATPAETAPVPAVESDVEALTAEPTGSQANIATIVSVRAKHMEGQAELEVRNALAREYGNITLLQKNSIGPSLASELFTNALLALVLAYILIVGYVTFRFQFDFAVCAMLALVHDSLFLIGMFAIFGNLFHTEIDSLFITAILTAIGFSVHDTIVVFDRVRENTRLYFTKKVPFNVIVNMSVNQTLVRSVNTSLTTLLTMLAMYFFGGDTTKDFVLAIILGIAVGTYSSIFNASVMLAMWREKQSKAPAQAAA